MVIEFTGGINGGIDQVDGIGHERLVDVFTVFPVTPQPVEFSPEAIEIEGVMGAAEDEHPQGMGSLRPAQLARRRRPAQKILFPVMTFFLSFVWRARLQLRGKMTPEFQMKL